jgi:MFS family permease
MWASIYLIAYVYSLASATTASYLQIATSAYEEHALLGTITIVNAVVSAAGQPFVAKLLDLSSRPAGYAGGIFFYILGFIVVASSKSIQAVAGGQVLSTIGTTFINLAQAVIVSDLTSLRNRALLQACLSVPWVLNAFVAGFITEGIAAYTADGWRWGYGMFCLVVAVLSGPAIGILFWGDRRAKPINGESCHSHILRLDLYPRGCTVVSRFRSYSSLRSVDETFAAPSGTFAHRVYHVIHRIDLAGLLLFSLGFGLLLVPFSLATGADGGYSNRKSLFITLKALVDGQTVLSPCLWSVASSSLSSRSMSGVSPSTPSCPAACSTGILCSRSLY